MVKPYIHWDPSVNASLHVRPADGPLIIDSAVNPELLELLVSKSENDEMFVDLTIDYIKDARTASGTPPKDGLRVRQSQYMPYNMAYGGGGEPLPLSVVDLTPPPFSDSTALYTHFGWRTQLRGYVGSMKNTGYAADVKVKWADLLTRNASDSRGGYTGLLIRSMHSNPGLFPALHHSFGLVHGKRSTDVNWIYIPYLAKLGGQSYGTTTILNSIDNDLIRIILSGGAASTIKFQRWIGAWTDLETFSQTLTEYIPPIGDNYEHVMIRADLFAGNILVQPGTPPSWPTAETWFSFIEMTQFEPFVLDRASWGYLEWAQHWDWLVSASDYTIHRRLPTQDLIHHTPGVRGAPTNLRVSDSDLGICVEFNDLTYLRSMIPWDKYGYAVTNLVSPVICDQAEYGYQAPIAMGGRFKFQEMAQWNQSYPIDIMAAGHPWSTSPGSLNGIGIYWEYTGPNLGQGKLVLRAWDDTASSWVDVELQFDATDYDDRPVDLAWAWSGARGGTIGRPNYELRIVINGVTKASFINRDIRVIGSTQITIGSEIGISSVPNRRCFRGLFRVGMVFADAVTDQDLRTAWDDTTAFDNPSFESADERPGEAQSWFWQSIQSAGGWAGFNEYHERLIQWATAFESFEAGFHFPHTWVYDDEAARLAAVGFTADDVGGMAWQRSDDTKWILESHSPITWGEVDLGANEDWVEDFAQLLYTFFNDGIPLYETTQEEFAIWDFEPFAPPALWIGPPWLDAYNLVEPYEDTLDAATDGAVPLDIPTGFRGWSDHITGLMEYPLQVDEFGEAWNTDPLSTAIGPLWHSGTGVDGRIQGKALTFPLDIVPDRRFLYVYLGYGQIVEMELTTGTYADATTLATMLEVEWTSIVGPATGYSFAAGTDNISFGWDSSSSPPNTAVLSMFGRRVLSKHNDARDDIGLNELGPGGKESRIIVPAATVPNLPSGIDVDEKFWFDGWSMLLFDLQFDTYISDIFTRDYDQVFAIFGAFDGSPDPTVLERFTLEGWIAAGAVWDPGPPPAGGASYTDAMFDSGTVNMEEFEDTNWPDHPYP